MPLPGVGQAPSPELQTICISCSADPLPVEWCDAWGEYAGGLERVLHAFKFGRHDFLDASLAKLLHETRDEFSFDAIVSVPMHWAKERRRGYNQAELLGRALAKRTGIAFDGHLLSKRQENETQSLLARAARRENVRRSFEASPRAAGQSVLIVDDICTTGETFRACARELVRVGATRVCAISVAKAV